MFYSNKACGNENVEIITTMTSIDEVLEEGFIPVDSIGWTPIKIGGSYTKDFLFTLFEEGAVDFIKENA